MAAGPCRPASRRHQHRDAGRLYVTAIVAGPVSISPLEWICSLLAVDADAFNHGGTPEFAAISAVALRHNDISNILSTAPEQENPLVGQQHTEIEGPSVALKLQMGVQMAFPMPKLKRLKSGAFSARKVIPRDVREAYSAQFGSGWEERFYANAGTPLGEAKRAFGEWLAEIERRVSVIRDDAAGRGRSLTSRETLVLAGEWYRWFVGQYEDEPGDPDGWDWLRDKVLDALLEQAPDWFRQNERLDPDWNWQAADVRVSMRPLIADKADIWHPLFLSHYMGDRVAGGILYDWKNWPIAALATAAISFRFFERPIAKMRRRFHPIKARAKTSGPWTAQ